MTNMSNFQLGSVYDFTIHAPSLLGEFKNVKIVGFGDHQMAQQYIDPVALHANIYGSLPKGVIDDYKSYSYVVVRFDNGKRTAVGLPWIQDGSITLKERNTIFATIEDVGPGDVDKINRILTSNGYNNVNLRID